MDSAGVKKVLVQMLYTEKRDEPHCIDKLRRLVKGLRVVTEDEATKNPYVQAKRDRFLAIPLSSI